MFNQDPDSLRHIYNDHQIGPDCGTSDHFTDCGYRRVYDHVEIASHDHDFVIWQESLFDGIYLRG